MQTARPLNVSNHIMKKTIEIDSYNPYDSIYPNRKVVTREILILIKTLRAEGYKVIVKPNDNRPIEYLLKKGATNFLADPVNLLIISIPINIVTGLITNWILKIYDNKKIPKSNNVLIVNLRITP